MNNQENKEKTTQLIPIGSPKRAKDILCKQHVMDAIERMLPKQYKPFVETFIDRAAMTVAKSKNQDLLLKCSGASLTTAVIEAAEYGFALDDKFVYAIPYNNTIPDPNSKNGKVMKQYEVQASFDYKALVAVARRHQLVIDVRAQDVRENDEFDYFEEDGLQRYRFRKAKGDRGKITGAYAVALLPFPGLPQGWIPRFEHMDIEELEKVRKASKAPNSPAWTNWKSRMYCKAPVKRTLAYVQDNPMLSSIIDRDNEEYDMDKVIDVNGVRQATEARVDSMDDLASQLESRQQARIAQQAETRDFSEEIEQSSVMDEAEKAAILAEERRMAEEYSKG